MAALATMTGTAVAATGTWDAPDATRAKLTVPVAADAFTTASWPERPNGTESKLTASSLPDDRKVVFLAFRVRGVPAGASDVRAVLHVTRTDHHLPGPLTLRAVPAGWTEQGLTARNAPALGATVAKEKTDRDTVTASFDVGARVTGDGTYAFAITSSSTTSVASFRSRESGDGATLAVAYRRTGATPTTGPASPVPSATFTMPAPTVPVPPSPGPTVTTTPAPPAARTLCGASFGSERAGQTYQEALAAEDARYGRLGMVRVFYPGLPAAWPGKLDADGRPMAVSFKASPADVARGAHDALLREWFAKAPKNQTIYWTFYHEPEDNMASGAFTSAQYRAAWRHLRALADAAHNPRLKATLVLMSWTLNPKSHRTFADYYPGRDVVQVLGWDAYNAGADKGVYAPAESVYGPAVAVSAREGLPFGIAETGSHLVAGDDGTGRAAWLRAGIAYLTAHHALWVAYFDHQWGTGDYRLRDAPSVRAWREFCG